MQLFDVAFGRNLLQEIPKIANTPILVVAAKDLWPTYSKNFDGSDFVLYTPDSLEIADLEAKIKNLPSFNSVVGFGGGVAIDVAKYVAWRTDKPLFQVPTSMSVNAPFAQRAAIRENGILKYVGFKVPEMVYVDYDIIQSAPKFINRSGVGDILCYYTGHWDYRYAVEKGKVESKWPLEEYWVSAAREVLDSVLNAADEIHEVSDEGIRILMGALRWGGAAFNNTGWNPRPIEGSEHTFFYSLEHLTHKPFLHGQVVALGVLLMSYLQGNDPQFIKDKMDSMGVAYQPEDMDITWDDVREGLKHMRDYWKQSGNLWYTIATESEITDEYLDGVQKWLTN